MDYIFEYDASSDDEFELILAFAIEEERLENERGSTSRHGSIQRRTFIRRNPLQGHQSLFRDYFAEPSVYPPNVFRRRFRMNHDLFLCIQSAVEAHDLYFVQKRDVAGRLGLSSLKKMTASLRMFAYGVMADFMDEYVRIGESTARKSMKKFVNAVVSIFGDEYLRSPNDNDITRLLATGQRRGFPGMLGSINCMHWKWKNCPSAWKGSHNDINVLERLTVFTELAEGRAPPVNYSINDYDYTMGYYLADGIYPSWSTFVKTIPAPQGNKRKYFAAAQESARKDVERAFGVLQARFAIVRGLARFFHRETLKDIMTACIILHNMIVEDERCSYLRADDFIYEQIDESSHEQVSQDQTPELMDFIQRHHLIRDREIHSQLQSDIVEHL